CALPIYMILRTFVKCGSDYLSIIYVAIHFSNLLGSLINEQNNHFSFGIILIYCIGNILHNRGLTRFRLRHNESPLAFPNRSKKIYYTGGIFSGFMLQL